MAEARNLRPVAAWMDLGIVVAGKARAGWNVLACLLNPWRKRKQETSDFVQKLAGGVSLARSLLALWKSWR